MYRGWSCTSKEKVNNKWNINFLGIQHIYSNEFCFIGRSTNQTF